MDYPATELDSKLEKVLLELKKYSGNYDADTRRTRKAITQIKDLMVSSILSRCPNCEGIGKVDCDDPTKTLSQNRLADDCEMCEWVREIKSSKKV